MGGFRTALTVFREDLASARNRDPSARSLVEIALEQRHVVADHHAVIDEQTESPSAAGR